MKKYRVGETVEYTPQPLPKPRLLRETKNYRIIAKPILMDSLNENEESVKKVFDKLVIEKRKSNTLEEPFFDEVDSDYFPQGIPKGYINYGGSYREDLWSFLKEMFLP